MSKLMYLAVLLITVLLLAACQQRSSATQSASVKGTEQAQAGILAVEPAAMTACDPAVQAVVTWDAVSDPGVNMVSVYVSSGASEKLFAQGGVKGQARTGPWTRPGVTFTAKDQASGAVLGSVTVRGPDCK